MTDFSSACCLFLSMPRVTVQPLGRELLLVDALREELLLGLLDEVAVLTAHTGRRLGVVRLLEGLLAALLRGEPLHLDHVVEGVGPALLDPLPAGRGRAGPVVLARRLEQRGQVGALRDVELLDVHAVVGLCGGLDAVGAAAVVAGVDVAGEDVVLAELVVHLERDDDLLELAGNRLLLAQVVVLDVLLGDRRTTLLAAAHHRVEDAARGTHQVDAGVVVEVLVLGGDEGALDVLGYAAQRDVLAVAQTGTRHDLAIGVLVDIALELGFVVPLGDVHVQIQADEAEDAQQAHPEEGSEELLPGEEPAYAGLLVLRFGPAGASLSRPSRVRSAHRFSNSSRSAPS